jgi:excisionase family DNA binding protein
MNDKNLSVNMVAKRLGMSRSHVYQLLDEGKLPFFKFGTKKGYRVRESDLKAYMRKCAVDHQLIE